MARGPDGLRIGLVASTPLVAEQVERVAEAAGAAVTTSAAVRADPRVDLWVVEDDAASGAGIDAPGATAAVVLVRAGGRRPVPLDAVTPGSGVVVQLPLDAEPLLRCLGERRLSVRAHTVGVVPARGGAGASTLAAALARVAVRASACSALVDLDGSGGGIDLLLGIEHEAGPRWADLRGERGGFPADALSMALPRWQGVRVLSGDGRGGPRPGDPGTRDAVRALVSEHDVVVVDLARSVLPALGTSVGGAAELGCDVVLLMTTCDVRSAAAAAVASRELTGHDVRLVVRTPGPGRLDPQTLAESCGVPLIATTRTERGAAAAAERGEAPGDRRRASVNRTATKILRELGMVA